MKLEMKTMFATVYFFIFGISVGTFMEVALSAEEKAGLLSALTGQVLSNEGMTNEFPSVFLHSAGNNLGLLALIALSGITVLGFPAAIAAVTYKGVALGFTSALILEFFPKNGAFLVLLSIVPQNFLLIPALIVAAQQASYLAINTFADRQNGIKKSLAKNAGPYLTIQFCLALIILLGCIIETVICPMLVQLTEWQ